MKSPFTLSIEKELGDVVQHGFHLGTDLRVAMTIAEELFTGRNKSKLYTKSVAIFDEGQMVDCFDGVWLSELADSSVCCT